MLWDLINSPVVIVICGVIIAQALKGVTHKYSVTGKEEFILVASVLLVSCIVTAILQGIGAIVSTIVVVKLARLLLRED